MKSHSKSKATIQRDIEAKIRLADRNKRTDQQQLDLLIARGAGDCKEANRIRERLGKPKVTDINNPPEPKKSRPARKRRKVPASLM